MKCTLIALLTLAAVPALAVEVKIINGQTTYVGPAVSETVALPNSGSLAGRAAALAAVEERAAAATFCQLPDSEAPGAPSQARNIDGMATYSDSNDESRTNSICRCLPFLEHVLEDSGGPIVLRPLSQRYPVLRQE